MQLTTTVGSANNVEDAFVDEVEDGDSVVVAWWVEVDEEQVDVAWWTMGGRTTVKPKPGKRE